MTIEIVDRLISVAEWLLILLIPMLIVITIRSWIVARRYWPYRLPLMVALINSILGACVTWVGVTVVHRWRVGEIPIEFLPVTALTFLVLGTLPFFTSGYLIYLDRERLLTQRRRQAQEGDWSAAVRDSSVIHDKLDTIHRLVDGRITSAIEAELEGLVRERDLLKEVGALTEAAGHTTSPALHDSLRLAESRIEEAEKALAERHERLSYEGARPYELG